MRNIFFLMITLILTPAIHAEGPKSALPTKEEKQEIEVVDKSSEKKEVAKEIEEELAVIPKKSWAIYGTYAMYDTWLPFKLGILASYGEKKGRLYELGYQKASYGFEISGFSLGNISDTKIYLTTRSHTWNGTLNFQYGLYYNSFEMNLGRSYLDSVGGNYDVVKIRTLGAMWSIGNRFDWDSGFSFGIDWFRIFYPFKVLNSGSDYLDDTNNSDDKEDIKEIIDTISNVPTFTIFNFEIGYRF
jgi:hypothetical protein